MNLINAEPRSVTKRKAIQRLWRQLSDLIVEEQEEVLRNQAALEYWGLELAERAKFDLDKYKSSLREQVIRPSTSAAACKLLIKFIIY